MKLTVALVLVAATVPGDRVDPDHVPMAAALRQARGLARQRHRASCTTTATVDAGLTTVSRCDVR